MSKRVEKTKEMGQRMRDTGNNYLHVATVLAQSEYRLKLLFNKYGLRVGTPFFNAVYQRIELTVAKATQAEAIDE